MKVNMMQMKIMKNIMKKMKMIKIKKWRRRGNGLKGPVICQC